MACAVAALTGCSRGEGPAPTPAATVATSAPAPVVTDRPRPTIPAAAKAPTPEGAEAFARYAMSVYGSVYQTGDTWPFSELGSPDCTFCANVRENVAAFRAKGHRQVGGDVTVREVVPADNPPPGGAILNVVVDTTPAQELDSDGRVVKAFDAETSKSLLVALTRYGDEWRIYDIGGEKKK
ncbi:MAG: DUF6318 family protein [Kineosporiaceae bacterium]